jgi:hypothetical protein
MNPEIKKNLPRFLTPEFFALFGLIVYFVQSIIFSQIHYPNLDEGAYLYKGYQFATGAYQPFQAYGLWTNKMYLSFYIFGWIQRFFSPGLLAPRLFAVFLGTFSVVGTWLVSRRLSNGWLAALVVWAVALNPTLISIYSIGNTQVLVIFILVWSLVLILGKDRPTWKIIAGSVLVGLMVFCRENMVFVLPFFVIYIFWQHGKRKGLLALGTLVTVLVIGHLIFWPEIMRLWERWIPSSIGSLLSLNNSDGTTRDVIQISLISRFHSLSLAIRTFIVPILGSVIALLLWTKKSAWKSPENRRAVIFLEFTFFTLLITHVWASIGKDYCVYCTTNYFAFWGNLGLILMAAAFGSFNKSPNLLSKILIYLSIPVISTIVWYSYFEKIGYSLMNLAVPRVKEGKILGGTVAFWQLLQNKFNVDLETSRALIPAIIGFVFGLTILFILIFVFLKIRKKIKTSFAYVTVIGILLSSILLSPLLSWPTTEPICKINIPATFSRIGTILEDNAPVGTKIFLDGLITAIPLLYTKDVQILPPQINGIFSFVNGGDKDQLLRTGFWNEEIAKDWRKQSQVFVIGEERIAIWQEYFVEHGLVEIPINEDFSSCPALSRVFIFIR